MALKQDVVTGAIFVGAGLCAIWLGRDYEFGSALSMGPAYLPIFLSWGLIGFGVLIALKAILGDSPLLSPWRLKPVVFILLAVGTFALLIETAGLALTVFLTAFIATFANDSVNIAETLMLAVLLAVGAVALFIYGLSLPLNGLPI